MSRRDEEFYIKRNEEAFGNPKEEIEEKIETDINELIEIYIRTVKELRDRLHQMHFNQEDCLTLIHTFFETWV